MNEETERREAIETLHAEGVAAATSLGESLRHKANRGDVWRVAAVVACITAAMSIGVSLVGSSQMADLRAERASERLKADEERESTRKAINALEEANRDLQARGQQPVSPPVDMQPDDTLVAATTARVLASLPPAPMPTAQQIGDAVAAHMIAHPVVISPSAVMTQVSAYLTANPPPPGEKGEPGVNGEKGDQGEPGADGQPGHTPTPEEIMAVFNQAAAQNPDILCAGKGKFTEVRGFVQVPPDVVPQERAFWVCLPQ